MRLTRLLAATAALALIAGSAACSADDSNSDSGSSSGASGSSGDSGAFPVSIETSLGSVTIPEKPERIVTLGWGSQDAALALGVVPVGMQDFTGDTNRKDGVLPWDVDLLKGKHPERIKSSSAEIPFEQILSLKPDVILAVNSGLTDKQYKRLSQIAPTVGYPGKPWLTSEEDQLSMVGKALGLSEKADKLQADYDKLVRETAKKHPEFKGTTIAFGSGTETGNYNFYRADDSRVELLKQLGFTPAPTVGKLPTDPQSSFSKSISLERISDVKADVLVSWYLDGQVKKSIEKTPTFAKFGPVKNDRYIALTDPPMVFATSSVTVLSLPWMLKRFVPKLSKAAQKA